MHLRQVDGDGERGCGRCLLAGAFCHPSLLRHTGAHSGWRDGVLHLRMHDGVGSSP